MKKDDSIGFRVPTELKRSLERVAEADHRSLGALCTLALMEFLERRGEWPARAASRSAGAGRITRARRASTKRS
jgi:predicted transcriptional regulator